MNNESTIRFADRMTQLPPYLFGMINKIKMEKRWEGTDVIDLGMGNPMDPTPEKVTEKLCEVAVDPKTHRYPAAGGMKNLKREIALYYKRKYGVELNGEDDVICTIGSKEGISHLCLALLGPGDTVLVPSPFFPIHVYAAVIAGASVLRFPLGSEEAFLSQVSQMCKSLYPHPKLVMLNYPHNPTGTLASKEFFAEMVKLAKRFHFMVINDFAYGQITYDGLTAPSLLEIPGALDVGVEFGSFSKSYNMAGWRLGYCVGNREMVGGLAKIKGYYDYGIFSAIQVAGIVAMRDCDDTIAEQVAIYQKRRDVLCEGLARMGWEVEKPKAGMFLWVKIPEPYTRLGSIRFSIEMMNRANVALAPGAGFGEEGDGWLRLALVENENRIRQALKQMKRALADIDQEVKAGTFSLAPEGPRPDPDSETVPDASGRDDPHPQSLEDSMFIINVWLTVKDPRNCDRVGELLAQMAEGVRKEDGCARFAAYRSESEPVRFLLNEHWQSREHWEAHRGARICKEIYEPLVLPLVTREAHPCSLVA